MKKFMDWMSNVFAPKMNKISKNAYVSAVQSSLLTTMPLILIGSFVTLIASFVDEFMPGVVDLWTISSFTMGLLSLFIAFLVPYYVLENCKHPNTKREAAIAGVILYLLLIGPTFDADGNLVLITSLLGNGGMLVALVAGLFTGFVMNIFAKHSFFGEDSAIPDFITIWFDTLIPILLIVVIGWASTFLLGFDMAEAITNLFSPILTMGESFIGFTLLFFFGYSFLYTFGISTWVIYPIEYTIVMQGLAANQAAAAAGNALPAINAYGASYYWTIGGGGCTLALGLMMLFLAKSKKCKVIGKATIVPSLANINEPIVFGAPIAFNPILMVPMWIIGLLAPALTWLALNFNLIPRVSEVFAFWYLPAPICAWFVGGLRGVLFMLFIFALSWVIYYPFFKVYDKQCIQAEEEKARKKAEKAALKAQKKELEAEN